MSNIRKDIIQILIDYNLVDTESDVYTDDYLKSIDDLDSISYISLLVAIEEHFNVSLPDSALTDNVFKDISTLEQLIQDNLLINTSK